MECLGTRFSSNQKYRGFCKAPEMVGGVGADRGELLGVRGGFSEA